MWQKCLLSSTNSTCRQKGQDAWEEEPQQGWGRSILISALECEIVRRMGDYRRTAQTLRQRQRFRCSACHVNLDYSFQCVDRVAPLPHIHTDIAGPKRCLYARSIRVEKLALCVSPRHSAAQWPQHRRLWKMHQVHVLCVANLRSPLPIGRRQRQKCTIPALVLRYCPCVA